MPLPGTTGLPTAAQVTVSTTPDSTLCTFQGTVTMTAIGAQSATFHTYCANSVQIHINYKTLITALLEIAISRYGLPNA
jgi:hypothetical protein